MIAGCPKCGARYRIERERLVAGGVRLRCARCEAVFRVRPPESPEAQRAPSAPPKPSAPLAPERTQRSLAPPVAPERTQKPVAPPVAPELTPKPAAAAAAPPADAEAALVLVAIPDDELARRTLRALEERGLRVLRASDGVEAMLEIQRKLPRAIVLAADLPKMFGFQICEVVKRNESLRDTWVVLVGAIHHRERYRRAPDELYGADAYVEGHELPAGLFAKLAQGGVGVAKSAATLSSPERPGAAVTTAEPAPSLPQPHDEAPAPAPAQTPRAPRAPGPRAPREDGLDDERAKAERLARIVVSDIVLYNEERFASAVNKGNVLEVMSADLAEGRQLFEERVDARVRAERDHLTDELLRRAQARGAH